jgi:hypothetical protein
MVKSQAPGFRQTAPHVAADYARHCAALARIERKLGY